MKKLLEEYLNEAYQIEGILICLSYKTKAELYIKKNNNIIKTIKDKKITKEIYEILKYSFYEFPLTDIIKSEFKIKKDKHIKLDIKNDFYNLGLESKTFYINGSKINQYKSYKNLFTNLIKIIFRKKNNENYLYIINSLYNNDYELYNEIIRYVDSITMKNKNTIPQLDYDKEIYLNFDVNFKLDINYMEEALVKTVKEEKSLSDDDMLLKIKL
jgi:hypothetical protein